jgi:hypothetical protein
MRHGSQQSAEGIVSYAVVKRGMADAGADRQKLAVACDFVEAGNIIDVDEMTGLGEPKGHDRNETLSARQHAAILRSDFGQDLDCLVEGFRRMVNEGRRLH